MRERIAVRRPLWTSYFASPVAEETKEEPAESGIDESTNIENYVLNECENISDVIEH